jgi:ABC-type antimicrobial peptide transport system permease subunit
VSLFYGYSLAAWTLEALLLAALGGLIFGRFCVGSYLFLVLTGQASLANRTLPWSRAE